MYILVVTLTHNYTLYTPNVTVYRYALCCALSDGNIAMDIQGNYKYVLLFQCLR